ncbi:MAG: hypothetical protein LH606_09420 [Cytophagaceae bacterium]|nr:hypothetical protein [Cytophagaceae bacterium]
MRYLLLFTIVLLWQSATAQECQPLTLAQLQQIYKSSDRPDRILEQGFSVPLVKADYSVVYQRCRKIVGYADETEIVTLPELITDGNRSRGISLTTYDPDTYARIQAEAKAKYTALTSLKSQSGTYTAGYSDGKIAYLFGTVNVRQVTGAARFRIGLMPISAL